MPWPKRPKALRASPRRRRRSGTGCGGQEYIAAYRASLVSQLENTYIVEPDGTKHKLGKKP